MKRQFASDNNSGIHPEVLAQIAAVNTGHMAAYGDDPVSQAAEGLLRQEFGAEAAVFFTFGGTGANVLGLKAITEPHHAIVCAASSHIQRSECGAVERFTGCKLLTPSVESSAGKLHADVLEPWLNDLGNQHHSQPRVVSITQATEVGTVYLPQEVSALSAFCRSRGLLLHMDGARLANAAAFLGIGLGDASTALGVDVLTFGGTKNGLLGGEVIVFADPSRARAFPWIRKQGMQLASKMRFVSAQFTALLTDALWRKNALHANHMAQMLGQELRSLGIEIAYPIESNAVFSWLAPQPLQALQARSHFYTWGDAPRGDGKLLSRLVTSFDTTVEDIAEFVDHARAVHGRH